MQLPKNKLLITITGPSGAGKSAIINKLLKENANIKHFVTATTRQPRAGERNGQHYYFLSKEEFDAKLKANEFLEHNAAYHGNKYGTLKSVVIDLMSQGYDVISDINWTGVAQFQEKIPQNLVKILIMPPSLTVLEERFKKRSHTSKEKAEVRKLRMEKIKDDILHIKDDSYIFTNPDMINSKLQNYDLMVTNDDLKTAVTEISDFIKSARLQR